VEKRFTALLFTSAALILNLASNLYGGNSDSGWYELLSGNDLVGWYSNEETPGVFSMKEGILTVKGGRSHLFWMGTESIPSTFENFELRTQVKTTPGSNSGLFFHTKYQESGWPRHGYEAQINTSHRDRQKTGSLYGVARVLDEAPSRDGEWFDYRIRVEGRTITIAVDGKVVSRYVEPENFQPDPGRWEHRKLGRGTIAIQGHDPHSTVYFRKMKVRKL